MSPAELTIVMKTMKINELGGHFSVQIIPLTVICQMKRPHTTAHVLTEHAQYDQRDWFWAHGCDKWGKTGGGWLCVKLPRLVNSQTDGINLFDILVMQNEYKWFCNRILIATRQFSYRGWWLMAWMIKPEVILSPCFDAAVRFTSQMECEPCLKKLREISANRCQYSHLLFCKAVFMRISNSEEEFRLVFEIWAWTEFFVPEEGKIIWINWLNN